MPLRVALAYALGASAWIVFSDAALRDLVGEADAITRWQSLKGAGFVLATTILLLIVLRAEEHRRIRLERARHGDRERVRLLSENVRDMVYRYRLTEPRGFEYVSPSSVDLTGYTPEEHYADPDLGRRLVHEADREELDRAVSDQPSEPFVLRWRRKDGSTLWSEQQLRTVHDDAGRPVALEGIARDVTAFKRAEELLQQARLQQQQLSRRLLHAQEQERRHLARELHDEFGQVLGALRINLHLLCEDIDAADPRLVESRQLLDELTRQVRNLSVELRPSVLDDLGPGPAVQWFADRLAERSGLDVETRIDLEDDRIDSDVAITAFRIVQEALNNVVKHADAHEVRITLSTSSRSLHLSVRDDGRGFDVEGQRSRALAGASLGLLSIVERAELIGGQAWIESSEGEGTEVKATLPLPGLAASA